MTYCVQAINEKLNSAYVFFFIHMNFEYENLDSFIPENIILSILDMKSQEHILSN